MSDSRTERRAGARMRSLFGLVFLPLGLMMLGQKGLSALPAGVLPYSPDALVVSFHNTATRAARLAAIQRVGLAVDPAVQSPYFVRLRLSPTARAQGVTVLSGAAALARDPAVRYAEPDYRIRTFRTPNDPQYSKQYALHNTGQATPMESGGSAAGTPDADIDAAEAWDVATGSQNVIVAVTDSGVDYTHPDLKDNIWINTAEANGRAGVDDDGNGKIDDIRGWDFAGTNADAPRPDADPMDVDGHGTHVAGIIGARGNNFAGVSGVCWNVRLMPLKVTDNGAAGYASFLAAGIDYAVQKGAKIINMSLGGYESEGRPTVLLEAIKRAEARGVLICVAASNEGTNNDKIIRYPPNFTRDVTNMIVVAWTDNNDKLVPQWVDGGETGGSNWGPQTVDLGAPGDNILSTTPKNTYKVYSGTSMASPCVAGTAALVLSHTPTLTMAQLKQRILGSVDPLTSLTGKVRTGGRLNVRKALAVGSVGDAFETDNTAAAAKLIVSGETQSRSIHTATDVDWAKFTLAAPGSVTIETGPATADTLLSLYGPTASTTLIATHNDRSTTDRSSRIQRTLAAGSYYVKVVENGQNATLGAYTLKLTVGGGDAYETDNTPAAAKVITPGQVQSRSLHAAADIDWVKFTVTATATVTVETGPAGADTLIALYGPNNPATYIAENNDRSASDFSSRLSRKLAPGTYYVSVESGVDPGQAIAAYTLKLTSVAVPAAP